MTQDEIIAMAKEAGLLCWAMHDLEAKLACFAALVAAKERAACAQVCEATTHRKRWVTAGINGLPMEPCLVAEAIRARSNHVA